MKKIGELAQALRSLFTFTPAQVRGIVWLLPLLAMFGLMIGLADRPHFEKSFLELADSAAVNIDRFPHAARKDSVNSISEKSQYPDNNVTGLFKPFDPNILDAAGFVALGFSPKQADVILRYRYSIGGFKSKEDFARCYVVSDRMMTRLAPYIIISNPKPAEKGRKENPTVKTESEENTVSDSVNAAVIPRSVDLNRADSAELRSVKGIGEVMVVRIMEYRERLGGFVSVDQLAEINSMYPENLELILEQICVDSCGIQKIDVNFAPHKTLVEQLGKHPYMTGVILRKLLKNRQLKGGWSTIGEMVEQNILTKEEAEKLSPYLLFRSE